MTKKEYKKSNIDIGMNIVNLSKQPIKRRTSVNAKPRLEECLNCVWGRLESGVIFCPLVGCMKHDQVFKNAK